MNILVTLMSLFILSRSKNYTGKTSFRLAFGLVNNILDARKKCLPNEILASLHEDRIVKKIEENIAIFRKFLKLLDFIVSLAIM